MKFTGTGYLTNILLIMILGVLTYPFFVKVDLTSSVNSNQQNPSYSESVIDNTENDQVNDTVAVVDTDKVNTLLEKKLKELEAKSNDFSDINKNSLVNANKVNTSCFVNVGNYSQPKFGFDKQCNPLTNKQKERKTALTLTKLPDNFTVNFKAENERDVIYVFTDYTCVYCKKLHSNLDKFNEQGITVKYIQFPRIMDYGPEYASQAELVVDNMSNAWCAPDQTESFHELYTTNKVEHYICNQTKGRIPSPVREHYILGQMLDLKHTPAIVSSKGHLSYGFSRVSKTLTDLGL